MRISVDTCFTGFFPTPDNNPKTLHHFFNPTYSNPPTSFSLSVLRNAAMGAFIR